MSRKKAKGKSKSRGSAKSTPQRPSKRAPAQSWLPEHDTAPSFSLKDEARWHSSHRSAAFDSGKKLRHLPIHFVSAGHLEGTIKEQLPLVESAEPESDDNSPAPSSLSSTQDNTDAMAHMAIRSPSPAASDASSSSDEVVFQGRGQAPATPVPSTNIHTPTTMEDAMLQPASAPLTVPTVLPILAPFATERQVSPAPPLILAAPSNRMPETQSKSRPSKQNSAIIAPNNEGSEGHDSDADEVVAQELAKRCGDKPSWEGTTTPWEHRSKPRIGWQPIASRPDIKTYMRGDVKPRDAALDDYMQNVCESGLIDEMPGAAAFSSREMDLDAGSHNDWESASGSQHDEENIQAEALGDDSDDDSWDSDMLQDFDDISTSSDVMDSVVRILRKRTRKSGVHYLCVYECSVIDDAHWLPAIFLKSQAEKQLIRAFEEEADLRQAALNVSESSDEADYEEDDSEEEDDDFYADELDDETLARVLQKQEELGLGSEELVLYGADEHFSSPADFSFATSSRSNKKRQSRVRGNRNTTFPSASAMVDALAMDPYGGFDIMDTERPSLKPKKKGRRGQMPPELDDSDLNEQLQNAWEADRAKKRLKKAEREELRQQGLLGRKGKGANLKVKYSEGIGMEDVVEEIREFLLGQTESLSLPPMDAQRRATIHQAAKFFCLSSRSRGDGQDRFTVLSKTTRTRVYTDSEFDQAITRKGFLKRLKGPLQGKTNAKPARGATFRSGPRARPQVGYRDGEKVGANAPELGPENRGHALMLRMGWSKGEALGTADNQGILHPIAHTVKINKAGLQ
ncbi:hypothetical protein DE146DRAFT_679373 [Phaeosphaeria sp. MPI-PUGE-AT-0046c]|nr:hypothetical protein DE146DRAFT_679373 [Phaeosphaeria sp. MPI-PUGE-AT-0046c]